MNHFEITKDIYSVGELAGLLGISEPGVRKWLQDGSVRAVRVKRRWFIPAEEVKRIFIEAGFNLAQSRPNLIIVVGGLKGGTGKTTMAVNLAALHAQNKKEILLVDADAQASAAKWAGWRDKAERKPRVACIQRRGDGLRLELEQLSLKYETIVVDAGGHDNPELKQALLVAHLALIPSNPSQFDIEELATLSPVIRDCKAFNPRLKTLVVLNRTSTNPKSVDLRDARELVPHIPEMSLSEVVISERSAIKNVARGKAIFEVRPSDPKAIGQFEAIYKEVTAHGTIGDATDSRKSC